MPDTTGHVLNCIFRGLIKKCFACKMNLNEKTHCTFYLGTLIKASSSFKKVAFYSNSLSVYRYHPETLAIAFLYCPLASRFDTLSFSH